MLFHFSYQYGPDTYLMQVKDAGFPARLREYLTVAKQTSAEFQDVKVIFLRDRNRIIYIYISVPLILSCCLSFMHGQTAHRRRLKLCMWPLPMGAGKIGYVRPASAASEAVI